jgi:hypothetical protein
MKSCLAALNKVVFGSAASFWFGLFPTVITLEPLMACVLFIPDRIISIVAIIQGCLMAASAFIRLQFLPVWMMSIVTTLGIISIIPPLMFASTSALIAIHPAQFKINQHDHPAIKIAIRICDAVFGCPRKTLLWHHDRTAELVNAIVGRHKPADSSLSQKSLILAANPMSARMLTLLFMAVFWSIFLFFFGALGVLSLIDYFFTFADSVYRSIPILLLRVLVVIFVAVVTYHLFDSLSKYRARYIRMSNLCRLQDVVSFHMELRHQRLFTWLQSLWLQRQFRRSPANCSFTC